LLLPADGPVTILNVSTTELFDKASKVDVPLLVPRAKAACDWGCVKLMRKGFANGPLWPKLTEFTAAGILIFGNALAPVV
jgi:hypothetical protein